MNFSINSISLHTFNTNILVRNGAVLTWLANRGQRLSGRWLIVLTKKRPYRSFVNIMAIGAFLNPVFVLDIFVETLKFQTLRFYMAGKAGLLNGFPMSDLYLAVVRLLR